jgi:hypothetical protein
MSPQTHIGPALGGRRRKVFGRVAQSAQSEESSSSMASNGSARTTASPVQVRSAPSTEVWNDDVLSEMQLRLVQDHPSARAASAAVERSAKLDAQARGGPRVRSGRSGLRVEDAAHHLGNDVRRRREHVLVGGAALRVISHRASSVAKVVKPPDR